MKTIQIEIPEGKKAEWVNGVLKLIDEHPQDITKQIKTLEDAATWCSKNRRGRLLLEYNICVFHLGYDINSSKDILAYLKLRIITAALNEGWEPTFDGEEIHYYPYTYIDIDKIGVDFAVTAVTFPATLCFKSKELAEYAITQFSDIYADFCGCEKGDKK